MRRMFCKFSPQKSRHMIVAVQLMKSALAKSYLATLCCLMMFFIGRNMIKSFRRGHIYLKLTFFIKPEHIL